MHFMQLPNSKILLRTVKQSKKIARKQWGLNNKTARTSKGCTALTSRCACHISLRKAHLTAEPEWKRSLTRPHEPQGWIVSSPAAQLTARSLHDGNGWSGYPQEAKPSGWLRLLRVSRPSRPSMAPRMVGILSRNEAIRMASFIEGIPIASASVST